MLHLAIWKNKSPVDYYDSYYFLPEFRTQAEYYTSIQQLGRLLRQINNEQFTERLDHKLEAYRTFTEAGLPTVNVVEVFDANGGRALGRTDKDLEKFLGQNFFVKPVNLYGGLHTTRWMYNETDHTYTNGEVEIPAEQLWEAIAREARDLWSDKPEKGARMVQPLLRNHPDLEPLSLNSLNSVRLELMRFPDGKIFIYHGLVRMAYDESVNDSFCCVSADINLETGRLVHGTARLLLNQKLAAHPATGATIEGRQVPYWKEVQDLAIRASNAFPQNPIVGWDFAVTPDGPLIMEANCNPNFNKRQFKIGQPHTKGIFADLYWSWIEANRNAGEP
jgi:hypothetical protein